MWWYRKGGLTDIDKNSSTNTRILTWRLAIMERTLYLDEVSDIVPEVVYVSFSDKKEETLVFPDGIVRLFSLISQKITPHSLHPLLVESGWGDYDEPEFGEEPGVLTTRIDETVEFAGWFGLKIGKNIRRVNSYYDMRDRALRIYFFCLGDYSNTRDLIVNFITAHPELKIKILILSASEKVLEPKGSRIIKMEKIFFLS